MSSDQASNEQTPKPQEFPLEEANENRDQQLQSAPVTVASPGTEEPRESNVTGFVAALWVSLGKIWKGRSVEALQIGSQTKNFALFGILTYSIIAGLLMATSALRSVNSVDSFVGSMSSSLIGFDSRGMISMSFGDWLGSFFVGFVIALVAFVLRALCIKWTFAARGSAQTFGTAGAILTTAYAVQMGLLLVATILFMIPSAAISGLITMILLVAALPVMLISEVLIYIGLNRTVTFEKSVLIPHALLTGAWVGMTAIATILMGVVFIGSSF